MTSPNISIVKSKQVLIQVLNDEGYYTVYVSMYDDYRNNVRAYDTLYVVKTNNNDIVCYFQNLFCLRCFPH